MGETVHVDFALERSWRETEAVLTKQLQAHLLQVAPAKASRAAEVAHVITEEIKTMRSALATHFALSGRIPISVPPGISPAVAESFASEITRAFSADAEKAIKLVGAELATMILSTAVKTCAALK